MLTSTFSYREQGLGLPTEPNGSIKVGLGQIIVG